MIIFGKARPKVVLVVLSAVAVAAAFFLIFDRTPGLEDLRRLTKEDPLFAGSGIECDKLSLSFKEMADLNTEILERTGFERNIVPVDFLGSICDVNVARSSFVRSGSASDARALISAYRSAQRAYEAEIVGLKTGLEFLLVADDVFITVSTFTTGEIILADLAMMERNAAELKREVDLREDILRGRRKYNFSGPSLDLPDIDSIPKTPTGLLDEEDLFFPREYAVLGRLYSAESSCFGRSGEEDHFYAYRNLRNGKEVFNLKLATDNYYSRHGSNSELARHLGMAPEEGHVFIPSKETNIYNCRDVDYKMSILAMDLFFDHHGDEPIIATVADDDHYFPVSAILDNAATVEKTVLSREVPSEREVSVLAEHYFNAYLALREVEGYGEVADEMLRRSLEIRDRVKGIDLIFNTTLFLDVLKTDLDRGIGLDQIDLYAIRSNYPTAFFNFSPAVWRIDDRPEYGRPTEILGLDDTPFMRYRELTEIHGRERVIEWNEATNMEGWHGVTIEALTN